MRYESIAARFLLTLAALLWTGAWFAEGSTQVDGSLLQKDHETVPNSETALLSIKSPLSSDINVKILLISMCEFYGPVRIDILGFDNVIKILIVMTTLSHLFDDIKYVGPIKTNEVLAYYMLLSELSFVKKRYPEELKWMLMKWPLPKGNLTLSLLISTGNINESTFYSLAFYLPYISNKSARMAAIDYCLDRSASGSMYLGDVCRRILLSASEPCVVHKLKQISHQIISHSAVISGCFLHSTPAELGKALVHDLDKALAIVARIAKTEIFGSFWGNFIRYPTTHRDQDTLQVIFKRNVREFQDIPFSHVQRTALSVVNKIKFGAVQDIMNMGEAEREALFDMLRSGECALVFHIWAREDAENEGTWMQFASDRSNTSLLSRLAFDPEGFFLDHFDVVLACRNRWIFCDFLEEFKYSPNSSKKKLFHELLRAIVQKRPGVVQALFWDDIEESPRNTGPFRRLVEFFIDQDDKKRLQALSDIIFQEIDRAPLWKPDRNPRCIVRICQRLGGCIDSLSLLAERIGAAKMLRSLDYSLIRANDMGEMLRILGIEWEHMDAALSNLSHNDKPEDELAAVMWKFHCNTLESLLHPLPAYHPLWFYLWNEHWAAFVKYVDPSIQQHYLPARPSS